MGGTHNGTGMNNIIHRRGGGCPPECIHEYTIRSVIGRANPAPTVDEFKNHSRYEPNSNLVNLTQPPLRSKVHTLRITFISNLATT